MACVYHRDLYRASNVHFSRYAFQCTYCEICEHGVAGMVILQFTRICLYANISFIRIREHAVFTASFCDCHLAYFDFHYDCDLRSMLSCRGRDSKMDRIIQLTKEGKRELENELLILENDILKKSQQKVKQARGFCDFSEDPVYAQYLEESFEVREKIEKLKALLTQIEVIEPTNDGIAQLGTYVDILEDGESEVETYQLVHSLEADIERNKLSVDSPLGQQLLGRRVGDVFVFYDNEFEVKEISIKSKA